MMVGYGQQSTIDIKNQLSYSNRPFCAEELQIDSEQAESIPAWLQSAVGGNRGRTERNKPMITPVIRITWLNLGPGRDNRAETKLITFGNVSKPGT